MYFLRTSREASPSLVSSSQHLKHNLELVLLHFLIIQYPLFFFFFLFVSCSRLFPSIIVRPLSAKEQERFVSRTKMYDCYHGGRAIFAYTPSIDVNFNRSAEKNVRADILPLAGIANIRIRFVYGTNSMIPTTRLPIK